MSSKADVEFLASLVHRGWLTRTEAEPVVASVRAGTELDDALVAHTNYCAKEIAHLRRTKAGEAPEIPGYQIFCRLGVGGTAEVFRVTEAKTGRVMALKILDRPCTKDAKTRKAFIGEAKLLESLEHRGLVKGYGVSRSGETYFTRLEFIDGNTLQELLDDKQGFDEEQGLRVVLQAAEVLRYLSSKGVIHRDVKAGNIMLSSSGEIKLIDLGFAAREGEATSDAGSAVGTVAYLSPEQARGGAAADLRGDVYSLGVTLFQLVVGRLPFESSDDQETLRMQVMETLRSPELKGRGFTPLLPYFIKKMMAKDAEHRYQSWNELIEDIESKLAGFQSLDFNAQARKGRRGPTRRP